MNVFISWSGERSKVMAETLQTWLAKVIQAVEPWISVNIEKGSRWSTEIAERLESTKVGIVCLTKDNLDSRWILFEVGALSKTKDAYVCTFLLDLEPDDCFLQELFPESCKLIFHRVATPISTMLQVLLPCFNREIEELQTFVT